MRDSAEREIKKKKKGVTLIEILIAMTVLVIGVFAIYQIFPMGFINSFKSKVRSVATFLAAQKMEEVLSGRAELHCLSEAGRTCKNIPVETGDDPSPGYYNSSYDCRYYYDSVGPGRGSILEYYDTGPVDNGSSWKKIPHRLFKILVPYRSGARDGSRFELYEFQPEQRPVVAL